MRFRKMHGLGNDFVILDQKDVSGMLTTAQIQGICDRNFGVGCDLLTVLEPSQKADIFARFYNADATESAACGNATRCVADLVMKESDAQSCTIETGRGVLNCSRADNDMITVDMGPALSLEDLDLTEGGLNNPVTVNMGNPHCIFFVDDIDAVDIETIGPAVENNPVFPNKTNVEFVQVLEEGRVRQRTWERGVGVTLACGSGACATVAAAQHRELVDNKAEIVLDGGSLFIDIDDNGHIHMTGPVAHVFDGTIKTL